MFKNRLLFCTFYKKQLHYVYLFSSIIMSLKHNLFVEIFMDLIRNNG